MNIKETEIMLRKKIEERNIEQKRLWFSKISTEEMVKALEPMDLYINILVTRLRKHYA